MAHAVAFGKILAPGLTLSQWTSSGRFVTEESSSVTPVCSAMSFYSGRLLTASEPPLSAAASSSFSGQSLFQIIVSFQ